MTDDPKMPEPVAYGMRNSDTGLILDVICPDEHRRHEGQYTVRLITTAAAQAYAEAMAAHRVAQERERCVAWIEARKDAFCAAHGYIDPDTGFLEFGRGEHAQAKHDYVSELDEIADGLRALSTQPPETGK